jgi:tetratricopeptide (TPR) repeat protein
MAVLDIEPHELSAISALVQCYTELKNFEHQNFFQERAKEARKHWADMVAKRSAAISAAAKKHEESAHYDSVIEVVNLGLETDPLNPDLLMYKAEALQKLKHLKESQACVLAVLKCHQSNARAHRLKKSLDGQIFDLNLKEGLDFLNRAELEKPGSPTQLSKVETALGRFLDALSFDGNNLTALAGVYRCHIRSGEPLKAQKTMARIRQIDSSFDIYSIFRDKNDSEDKSELCFVATRVFGEMHPNTVFLRSWRDNSLRNYLPGRIFIKLYRRIGPSLAKLPPGSQILRLSRVAIEWLTRLIRQVSPDQQL